DDRLRRQAMNDIGNGGAMTEGVTAFSRNHPQLNAVADDSQIIGQLESLQRRRGNLDSRIENRHLYSAPRAMFQVMPGLIKCKPRVQESIRISSQRCR